MECKNHIKSMPTCTKAFIRTYRNVRIFNNTDKWRLQLFNIYHLVFIENPNKVNF